MECYRNHCFARQMCKYSEMAGCKWKMNALKNCFPGMLVMNEDLISQISHQIARV